MLTAFELDFETVRVALNQHDTRSELEKYSPTAKVPVLLDGELEVWDSLAICEYVSECYLDGAGWPADPKQRATARSVCAEMHSGFFSLRESMPMNCRASGRRVVLDEDLVKDIKRIDQLWNDARRAHSEAGPWLYGEFSIADCMFAPVVMRFLTYGVEVSEHSRQYMENLSQHPAMQLWLSRASAEQEVIDVEEVGLS